MSQLPLVRMDDCFMTLCPANEVLKQDPPSFEAECAPLDQPIPLLSTLPAGAGGPAAMVLNCAAGDDDACLHLLAPLSMIIMAMLTLAGFLLFQRGFKDTSGASCHRRQPSGFKQVAVADARCTVRQPLVKYLHYAESNAGHKSSSVSTSSSPMMSASRSTSGALFTPFSQAKHE